MNGLLRSALAGAVLALVGAGVACSRTPQTPIQVARSSVVTLSDAWTLSAKACLDVAQTQNDDTIRQKCAAVLDPARDSIYAAAAAIDGWDAAAAGNPSCALADAGQALQGVEAVLVDVGATVPAELVDSIAFAIGSSVQCNPDAGDSGASDAGDSQ